MSQSARSQRAVSTQTSAPTSDARISPRDWIKPAAAGAGGGGGRGAAAGARAGGRGGRPAGGGAGAGGGGGRRRRGRSPTPRGGVGRSPLGGRGRGPSRPRESTPMTRSPSRGRRRGCRGRCRGSGRLRRRPAVGVGEHGGSAEVGAEPLVRRPRGRSCRNWRSFGCGSQPRNTIGSSRSAARETCAKHARLGAFDDAEVGRAEAEGVGLDHVDDQAVAVVAGLDAVDAPIEGVGIGGDGLEARYAKVRRRPRWWPACTSRLRGWRGRCRRCRPRGRGRCRLPWWASSCRERRRCPRRQARCRSPGPRSILMSVS